MTVKPAGLLPFSPAHMAALDPSNIYLYNLRSYSNPSQLFDLTAEHALFNPFLTIVQ